MNTGTVTPSSQSSPASHPYEPPRIESLGTVRELTMGGPTNSAFDSMLLNSNAVSDRRLKRNLEVVDGRTVLDRLAAL